MLLYTVIALCLTSVSSTPSPGQTAMDVAVESIVLNADRNADGIFSFDEIWSYVLHFDTDNDGKIGKIEFTKTLSNGTYELLEGWPDFFDAVDGNRDRVWEREDLHAFYKQLDVDHNGKVSKEELSGIPLKVGEIIKRIPPFDNYTDYGFGDADTNGDGQLTFEEGWKQLLSLIMDNNGSLSYDEMTKFTWIPRFSFPVTYAAWELFYDYDQNWDHYLDKGESARFFSHMDTNGDGVISRNFYTTYVETCVAIKGGNIRRHIRGFVTFDDNGFEIADTNHDGYLTMEEAWNGVLTLDMNDDEEISTLDVQLVFRQMSYDFVTELFKKLSSSRHLHFSDFSQDFKAADLNGDEKLSRNETRLYKRKILDSIHFKDVYANATSDHGFADIDTDKDDRISYPEEWAAILRLDSNGDKRISQKEFCDSLDSYTAPAGPQIFARFDVDSDGFWQEADVTHFFTQVDSDSDGVLSPPEYISFMESLLDGYGVLNDYGFGLLTRPDNNACIEWSSLWEPLFERTHGELHFTGTVLSKTLNISQADGEKLVKMLDMNGDGDYSFQDCDGLLDAMDTDSDDCVSRNEYCTYIRKVLARFPADAIPDKFMTVMG